MPKKYKKQLWVYLFLGILLFFMLANKSFFSRMGTIEETVAGISENSYLVSKQAANRIDFWKASIRIFKDHPMGIGVNNFANIVPQYDPLNPGMDPHNTYVLCYSEIGIIGISLFLYIIMKTFLELRELLNRCKTDDFGGANLLFTISLLGVLIVYCFGYSMTHSTLYSEIFWIYLALPTCLINSVQRP